MLRPYSLPLVASFILAGLLLAACSGGADDSVDTTLASTTTTAATTTTTTTTVEDQAVAVTEKDLVYATWEEGSLMRDGTRRDALRNGPDMRSPPPAHIAGRGR